MSRLFSFIDIKFMIAKFPKMYRLKRMKNIFSISNIVKVVTSLLIALTCISCAKKESTAPASFDKFFPMSISNAKFSAQIAIEDAEKALGLMNRDSLGDNEAMLFYYNDTAQRAFWMRNTKIDLDLGFFNSEGILLEVKKLYAYDERSVFSSSDKVQFCLETNAGWFDKNKISVGDKLDMNLLKKAIKDRGGK